jgi:SAM-dependent methyltransferase
MYAKEAAFYDKLYAAKDYRGEVERLIPFIRKDLRAEGKRLLDAACGTGRHLEFLRQEFEAEGLDNSPELLAAARLRNPALRFHQADLLDFDLGRTYEVITCLFSSIGYLKTLDNAGRAVRCLARHLVPGGILVLEPWFTPGAWKTGNVQVLLHEEPGLKIARMSTSGADGRLSTFDFHYLVGTPEKTEHFVERHELGLFETEELRLVLSEAGLSVRYDPEGLTGRGLFIGRKTG